MFSGTGGGGRPDGERLARPVRPFRRPAPKTRVAYAPRGPRDYDDFPRRFQDSSAKIHSGEGSPPVSAYYNSSKYDAALYSLPEDPRISKLLRRLCGEPDSEKALSLCAKLRETVMLQENCRYVRRAYDNLAESLLIVFYDAPDCEVKTQAADVLGRVGYVMGPEYKRHLDWVISKYESQKNEEVKKMLILSFCDLFKLDAESPSFGDFANTTIKKLQFVIETTDSSKIFTVAVDAIVILAQIYPESFAKSFFDVVDILVGWHMDASQSRSVRDFALKSLEKFGHHWQGSLAFPVTLLGNFVDDIVAYGDNLENYSDNQSEDSHDCIQSISSFISVFNTVAKCLGEMFSPNNSKSITWSFLSESFGKILKTIIIALKMEYSRDLIVAGNESIFILLEKIHNNISSNAPHLYELIELELSQGSQMDDKAIVSLLDIIRKIVKEISSNLQLEFITTVIGPNSYILILKGSRNKEIQDAVISVYQYLLNLKNIPLLQDAYKYVIEDIEKAYKTLLPDVEILSQNNSIDSKPYDSNEAEYMILFNVQCLSDIANASNSIIGMWALQPSILELLAVKMVPYDDRLTKNYPYLQYSIIFLLYSHCRKNNHFIASSDLVTFGQQRSNVCDLMRISNINLGETSTTSPTSGHFVVILTLFGKLFRCPNLPKDTLILLLSWIADIFNQLVKSYTSIFHSKYLTDLILDCVSVGFSSNEEVLRSVLKILSILEVNGNVHWNYAIMRNLGELCMIHADNNDETIRDKFISIFSLISWDITLDLIKTCTKIEKYKSVRTIIYNGVNIKSAQKEHLTKDTYGQMTASEFKAFMNYLLLAGDYPIESLKDSFLNCWPIQNFRGSNAHLDFFRGCALSFASVLSMWATWEAAQLCTTLKLRTPLGKPQETFTSIESAIKQLAREFTSNEDQSVESDLSKLKRSRMLIEFFENLEKSMQNAIDGCAVVLLPMEKPVRTFFHTNSMTCQEWVNRVRPAALFVALNTGHASISVRHSQSLLYTPANKSSPILTSDLLSYCVSLARALLMLKEPESLIGLFNWIKQTYSKKFNWLKAAADQGAMRYESAVNNYMSSLKNDTESIDEKLQECEKKFIYDQIIECHRNLHSWGDLITWKDELLQMDDYLNNINFEDVACYNKFQENMNIFPQDLTNWDVLSFEDDSKNVVKIFDKTEITLKNIALKIAYENDAIESSDTLESCIKFLQAALHELSRNQPCELLPDIHILHYAATSLKNIVYDRKQVLPFFTSPEKTTLKNLDPIILNKIIWWCDYFFKVAPTDINAAFLENMRLDLVKSARKHGNYKLSNKELVKYFHFSNHFQMYTGKSVQSLDDICNFFLKSLNSYDLNVWSSNNVIAVSETAKLLYTDETTKEKAMNLCASASLGVSQKLTLGEHSYEFREKGTRMLLMLSKWVQNENDKLLTNNLNSPLTKLVTALPEIGLVNNNISAHVIPISDSAVGKLLQFSVNQCPGFAKAWFTFGSWCFRWGKKMVEFSSNTGSQLTENDKLQIQSILMQSSPEDFERVCEILSKIKVIYDDEDIDWSEINTSDMIENQLRSVPCLKNAYPENVTLLVDIWRQAQKRVFSYYELSADAYFKFLDLNSSSDFMNHNGECAVVTATLRLLKLIVKHAMELQNVLETGLANTPTQPWKVIIPQLFSRLNHPENYVRCRVSELLCRLAEDAPHLITFPAVVGAVENKKINITDFSKSALLDTEDGDEFDFLCSINDNALDDGNDDYLNACFLGMVETLSNQAPKTILQVQLLVTELRRINLLWDELWLRTLAQHHSGITKRLMQLNSEIIKVNANNNLQSDDKEKLIKEKHRIFMKPILFVLEQLAEITNASPETPYERSFQDKFGDSINELLEKLQHPTQIEKPLEYLQPIKQLQTKLQQRANKRSPYSLKMSDISPVLAGMRDTVISMPGVQTNAKVRITIKSIDNVVSILPSKTKPKKLIFHGSDGRSYIYLFKGLEDLHLDERIMQFLSITNIMMAQDKEDNMSQTYRARHYSVIPLGPRSGLISWVENLTPLFALYKRWQQREALALSAKNNSNKPTTVLRPSELFYNKLIPLLNAAGVSTENRKEWPINILKQVLVELMAETPSDLLSRELWSSSVSAGQWWHTVRRYSFSMAVMSTIGYIIGLGDRHLDNVLIDLSTGEVVHIDYNVCFEDGKTLRIPEKVPFRMTPNLERCLGATGIEGIFRMACEHVLKTMKRGRKTLLTLLEAFVYDPLVEWSGEAGGAAGAGGGTALVLPGKASALKTAAIERRCALDLLAVRIFEVRHSWIENRNEIQKHLPLLRQCILIWTEQKETLLVTESQLKEYYLQLALIKELEVIKTSPKLSEHPFYLTAQRYSSYKQTKDALDDSEKSLLELHGDCASKIESFIRALETIKGPQLSQWIQELKFPIDHVNHKVFTLIHDFLMNAGKSSMITQCDQSETELGQSARQQTLLIKNCLDLLTQFAAMAQYFPRDFIDKHRIVMHRRWTAALLKTDLPEECSEVLAQIHNFRSQDATNNPSLQQVMGFSYQLQNINNDANIKLNKIYERLKAEGGTEALLRSEKFLVEPTAAITNFISQGTGPEKAMECVIINTLCNLNRRFLMLESSAQSAGDRLVDLTSREGDWFLDDMNVISSLVASLTTFMPIKNDISKDDSILKAFDCLKTANSIFNDLRDLSINFQTIILPEAIQKIQSEEPSVIMMINELNSLIINTDCSSLSDLIAQLEVHLRLFIMEMESPSTRIPLITSDLKMRYKKFVDGFVDNSIAGQTVPTPGRMLLMGSDGLFTQLGAHGTAILDMLSNLNIPHIWKKVDQMMEASDLSATLHNKQLRAILDDIFLIKRIQAIAEFFNLCVQMSCAFKGVGPIAVFDDESLCKPIKRFMADYIMKHFLGVQSQCLGITICYLLQRFGLNVNKEIEQRHIGVSWKVPLSDLCESCISTSIKNGVFSQSLLKQANALCASYESAFRRRETILILDKGAQLQSICISRLRLQIAAHSWLRGEGRGMSGGPTPGLDLRRAALQLSAQKPQLAAALEKHRHLVTSAEQRLKWAAGANPALSEVMAAFECAVNIREDRLNVEHALAAAIGNTCLALGGINLGNGSRDLPAMVNRRRAALTLMARSPHTPTRLHESILELLPPEGNIDAQWISNAHTLIHDKIMKTVEKSIADIKIQVAASEESLKVAVNKLNSLKMSHELLIFDAKSLLKVISKTQESISVKANEYLTKHKAFVGDLTGLIEAMNTTEKNISDDLIDKLELGMGVIYDELLSFETVAPEEENGYGKRRGTLVRQMAGIWNSPAKQIVPPKGRNQQANAYAVSVWKRVRLKLEGRDPDPARRHSNQEQIDYIIKEAMSLDNLCLLYEGWTPWV